MMSVKVRGSKISLFDTVKVIGRELKVIERALQVKVRVPRTGEERRSL